MTKEHYDRWDMKYMKIRLSEVAHHRITVHAKIKGNSLQQMFEPVVMAIANNKPVVDVVRAVAVAMGRSPEDVIRELKRSA